MSVHDKIDELQTKLGDAHINMDDGTSTAMFWDEDLQGYMVGWGTSYPVTRTGWAPGAYFTVTTGAGNKAYVNQGSNTVSIFAALH